MKIDIPNLSVMPMHDGQTELKKIKNSDSFSRKSKLPNKHCPMKVFYFTIEQVPQIKNKNNHCHNKKS
jgi:hypothetical protein